MGQINCICSTPEPVQNLFNHNQMEACKLSSTQMRPTHAAIAEIGQSVKLNNKIVFGGLFLVIAVSCATFGLTLGAVELAKEAKVSSTGVLTSMTGQAVKVECVPAGDDKNYDDLFRDTFTNPYPMQ